MSDKLDVIFERVVERELVRNWTIPGDEPETKAAHERGGKDEGRMTQAKKKSTTKKARAARAARTEKLLSWRDEINAQAARHGAKVVAAALNGMPVAKKTTKRLSSAEACRLVDAGGTTPNAKPKAKRARTMRDLAAEWNADPARARS